MISQVTIKNFKCLRDVTVELQPFTVFVGANGSGKTSILQAIDLLCRTFRADPGEQYSWNINRLGGRRQRLLPFEEILQNRSYGITEEVELSSHSDGVGFSYRTNTKEKQTFGEPHQGERIAKENNSLDWVQWNRSNGLLPKPVWLQLESSALRDLQQDPVMSDRRFMSPNGVGLHTATASMALENPDEWQKLQSDLRRIVPAIHRLRHTPESELLFDTINGKGLKANQVSEGTVLTLGILTAIHAAAKPGILLLDDLDRGLHPKAQRELVELLRGVQEANPEIQIVASTHSPYLLDRMKPSEVIVTFLREDGSTACEPLTHHPKFEKWKDEFAPGEMWSYFGEKWVAEMEAVAQ